MVTARGGDPERVEHEVRARVAQWRELFGRHVQLSRQALQKLLVEKIVCTPKADEHGAFYELRARLSFGRIFSGILCPSGVASLTRASLEPRYLMAEATGGASTGRSVGHHASSFTSSARESSFELSRNRARAAAIGLIANRI
jgi:hypothetical protein